MAKFKVKTTEASQQKQALEMGDVAPIVTENFSTLTNPKFEPRLELLEADPHTPPTMDTNTDYNIDTDGEDSNRPDASDITSKSPEYENAPDVAVEDIPHENEHVKQGAAEVEEEVEEESSEEEDQESKFAQMQAEYSQKYSLATNLFDIKLAAGIEQEGNRYNFATSHAENYSIADLQEKVSENKQMLDQIVSTQETKTASTNVRVPLNFNGGPRKEESNMDDIETVLLGSL